MVSLRSIVTTPSSFLARQTVNATSLAVRATGAMVRNTAAAGYFITKKTAAASVGVLGAVASLPLNMAKGAVRGVVGGACDLASGAVSNTASAAKFVLGINNLESACHNLSAGTKTKEIVINGATVVVHEDKALGERIGDAVKELWTATGKLLLPVTVAAGAMSKVSTVSGYMAAAEGVTLRSISELTCDAAHSAASTAAGVAYKVGKVAASTLPGMVSWTIETVKNNTAVVGIAASIGLTISACHDVLSVPKKIVTTEKNVVNIKSENWLSHKAGKCWLAAKKLALAGGVFYMSYPSPAQVRSVPAALRAA